MSEAKLSPAAGSGKLTSLAMTVAELKPHAEALKRQMIHLWLRDEGNPNLLTRTGAVILLERAASSAKATPDA